MVVSRYAKERAGRPPAWPKPLRRGEGPRYSDSLVAGRDFFEAFTVDYADLAAAVCDRQRYPAALHDRTMMSIILKRWTAFRACGRFAGIRINSPARTRRPLPAMVI